MADQIYFTDGDFYQCATAASAGESPAAAPAKWRKVRLLAKWRFALAVLTYAGLLRMDGQNEKAAVEEARAYARTRTGLDDLIRAEANSEEQDQHDGCRRNSSRQVGSGRNRAVKASVILNDAYRLIGWDADQLDEREKADARTALSAAVQEVWEAWWWQELMTCAPLTFASAYVTSPTNPDGQYVTGYVVYYPTQDDYRMKMSDGDPGSPPANPDWYEWQEAEAARWDANTAYGVASRVQWGGLEYYGSDVPAGFEPGTVPAVALWLLLPVWWPSLPWVDTATAHSTSHTPDSYTGPYGPVRGVSKHDPRSASNPEFYELTVTETGTRVLGLDTGRPWVWARRVTPILTGDDYAATATYEATDPQDLVYDS